MRMLVLLQKVEEEWAGSNENHLVRLHLLTILTGQGHISEMFVLSQISKGGFNIFLEIVPLEAQLF